MAKHILNGLTPETGLDIIEQQEKMIRDPWDEELRMSFYDMWRCRQHMQEKKKRFRDLHYRKRGAIVYQNLSVEEGLKRAMLRAALHARTIVCNRDLVPERKMRVGEFVTSLRRELCDMGYYKKTSYHQSLTNTDCWYDILELKANNSMCSDIKNAVRAARLEINSRSTAEVIEEGLKQVDNGIRHAMNLLKDIQSINDEAEEILDDFKVLAKNMQD